MVTLLGFFFILGNVTLLVAYVPEMKSTVRPLTINLDRRMLTYTIGPVVDLLQLRLWPLGLQHYGQY